MNVSISGLTPQAGLTVLLCPRQCFLRLLRAVPHHRPRHCPQPVRVAGIHLRGEHHPVGLRAVVGGDGQHHHRDDPGQHVWRHVAVEHQPQRCVPGEPGHGEQTHRCRSTNQIRFNFIFFKLMPKYL